MQNVTEPSENTMDFAAQFVRLARELDRAREQELKLEHLTLHACRAVMQAVRTLLRALDADAISGGGTLKRVCELVTHGRDRLQLFENAGEYLLIPMWTKFITPWLRDKAPDAFKPGAGEFDFRKPRTDKHGRLVDRRGKPLKVRRSRSAVPGATEAKLVGECAYETDRFDGQDWLSHVRAQVGDWADACRAAARLVQQPEESPVRELPAAGESHIWQAGPLMIDQDRYSVKYGPNECLFRTRGKLPFRLLIRLCRAKGRHVSFDDLLEDVWGGDRRSKATIRGTVTRLKQHLERHNLGPVAAAIFTESVDGGSYACLDSSQISATAAGSN